MIYIDKHGYMTNETSIYNPTIYCNINEYLFAQQDHLDWPFLGLTRHQL